MLVAREQLDFVQRLVAQFGHQSTDAEPLTIYQAQYIAIVAMLRSIGQVFEKVDCDNAEKKAWAKSEWPKWKRESIFKDFIEPARNLLLKQFRGGLTLRNPGISGHALTGAAASNVVWIDPDQREDSEGEKIMPRIHEAIRFWDRVLPKTDDNWPVP